jgi:hypothetical protein
MVATRLGLGWEGTKTTTVDYSGTSCKGGGEPVVDNKPTVSVEDGARTGEAHEGQA